VGETEEVKESVEDEATEFRAICHAIFAGLGAGPVAGDIDFAKQAWFAGDARLVGVERDDVGGPVALQEPAVERVNLPVVDEDDVDHGRVRLEVARELPAEAPDVGAEASATGAVDLRLQDRHAELGVSR